MATWSLSDIKKQSPEVRKRIEEALERELTKGNKSIVNVNTREKTSNLKEFDSVAESLFYAYLNSLKEIDSIECHKRFTLLDKITSHDTFLGKRTKINITSKRYTPDFFITLKDGRILVIETKGSVVKKLQRDFSLRIHLFIKDYIIPNNWTFAIVPSEYITDSSYLLEYNQIKDEITSFLNKKSL